MNITRSDCLPRMIDFAEIKSKLKTIQNIASENAWVQELGYIPFEGLEESCNGCPDNQSLFYYIKNKYQIDVAVETGTHKAATTLFLSTYFKEVHSVELSQEFYNESKHKLRNVNNATLYLDSSQNVLEKILPNLKDKKIFFYLDAHGHSYWPLLDELSIISKTHKDNCVIVIDDCLVPGRSDITFDMWNGIPCCYDFFRENLEKVFTEYTYHYVIPEKVNRRARFMAIPKVWAS